MVAAVIRRPEPDGNTSCDVLERRLPAVVAGYVDMAGNLVVHLV
jgi:hypothetical protein